VPANGPAAGGRGDRPGREREEGQFLAPDDMRHAVAKIESTGNRQIILTERGASYGYHNLVVDMRAFRSCGGSVTRSCST